MTASEWLKAKLLVSKEVRKGNAKEARKFLHALLVDHGDLPNRRAGEISGMLFILDIEKTEGKA